MRQSFFAGIILNRNITSNRCALFHEKQGKKGHKTADLCPFCPRKREKRAQRCSAVIQIPVLDQQTCNFSSLPSGRGVGEKGYSHIYGAGEQHHCCYAGETTDDPALGSTEQYYAAHQGYDRDYRKIKDRI